MIRVRRRGLTPSDVEAWASYARSVTPLDGRALPAAAEPAAPALPTVAPVTAAPAMPARPPARQAPVTVGDHPGGLDKSTWNRFRAGKLVPTRTLDLHGRTAQRAYHALHEFLLSAHADRLRCVEVITGRGSGEQGGVLKRELPIWLNLPALRPLVLAAGHPHAANTGSVRLLLRRPRP